MYIIIINWFACSSMCNQYTLIANISRLFCLFDLNVGCFFLFFLYRCWWVVMFGIDQSSLDLVRRFQWGNVEKALWRSLGTFEMVLVGHLNSSLMLFLLFLFPLISVHVGRWLLGRTLRYIKQSGLIWTLV